MRFTPLLRSLGLLLTLAPPLYAAPDLPPIPAGAVADRVLAAVRPFDLADGRAPGLVRTFRLPIPRELAREKKTLPVRFQSRGDWDGATASVFECLLVPTNAN